MNTNTLVVGRIYTNEQDCFKLLISNMDLSILKTRTSAVFYFTVFDGKVYAARTGENLLRSIVEQDELISRQLSVGLPIRDFLYGIWAPHIEEFLANPEQVYSAKVHSIMAEHVITWEAACEYFDDVYNQGLLWKFLTDYEYYPGDMLDVLTDYDREEMVDRAQAWEADRALALSRLTKHYFAVGMIMHNNPKIPAEQTAHAFAAFMDNYDSLEEAS